MERSGHDPSYLLRGEEIRRAEGWLAARGDRATPVEQHFLANSKEVWAREKWRQRATQVMVGFAVIAGVLLLALIVCIVLLTRRVGRRRP